MLSLISTLCHLFCSNLLVDSSFNAKGQYTHETVLLIQIMQA